MAVLSAGERAAIRAVMMQECSRTRTVLALTKADLIAAVNAIDQWIDDNAAGFNQAIPQPARAALSAQQKAQLFFIIARRRFEVS